MLFRAAIGIFLLAILGWAWSAGTDIREQAWLCSRSIRFQGDLSNAMRWGNNTLRMAEALSDGRDPPSMEDRRTILPRKSKHRPTLGEIIRGEGGVYSELVSEGNRDDYLLDYPPLRLLTMALWTRAFQDKFPTLRHFPGKWGLYYNASSNPAARATEDITQPLLQLNTLSAALSSLLAMALVWLWVDRGERKDVRAVPPELRLTASAQRSLRQSNGMLLFPVSVAALFYSISIALLPTPAPPPAVAIGSRAAVSVAGTQLQASVRGTVDPQGAATRWFIQWGPAADDYDHATEDHFVSADSAAVDVEVNFTVPADGQVIHYRLVARNDEAVTSADSSFGRGSVRTADATLIATAGAVQPAASTRKCGAVWLDVPQWSGIALLFVLTCAGMRILPPQHRGWACGLVAALFIWFDPALLIDAHIWPQWDVWVLPPFLLAALLASLDWWFAAGMVIGAGAMCKGQLLLGAPVLIVWPLMRMRLDAAVKLAIGCALSAGLIVSPWLVLNDQPISLASQPVKWIIGIAVSTGLAACLSLFRGRAWQIVSGYWPALRLNWSRPFVAASKGEIDGAADESAHPSPVVKQVARSKTFTWLFAASAVYVTVTAALLVFHGWPPNAGLGRSWGLLLLLAILLPP